MVLTLSQTSPGFHMSAEYKSFENTVDNREMACNMQFLLFAVFSNHSENFLPFSANLKCRLQTLSVWKRLKFVVWERVNESSLIYFDANTFDERWSKILFSYDGLTHSHTTKFWTRPN